MPRALKIDVHAHLAGLGDGESGCWTSPRFRRRYLIRALQWLHGIDPDHAESSPDADWAALLARRVRGSELDHAVALG
ncbi:MAG TPA: hypothetical protein VFX98_07140, partial [Longimicrobiaceae bacterium]|nr:hypothetical protein [Longimicrobiaceae bacterium]